MRTRDSQKYRHCQMASKYLPISRLFSAPSESARPGLSSSINRYFPTTHRESPCRAREDARLNTPALKTQGGRASGHWTKWWKPATGRIANLMRLQKSNSVSLEKIHWKGG